MRIRIGIDVGGTFTDAVAINDENYEVVGIEKVPTTHSSENGVADGIIEVLHKVMKKHGISPEDIIFIAHGTTQATNALLEGDVVDVGIITLGSGLEGIKSKSDTTMGNIELTDSKKLETQNEYIDNNQKTSELIVNALNSLKKKGCESIVVAEAFSVDDPTNEFEVMKISKEEGIPATATSEISKLYGLKTRTRTAVVNASIMPKMLQTANMTNDSIKKAGIKTSLMVMRCDGGVMTVDDVKERPILTTLSGPAAGVAGALMYEKLTDGLFFEVGGTSTDISCVKDGKVMVKYSEIGGHKTYLTSLDVRTVGIGGGSMIAIENGKIVDVGPRSAHIVGLPYEVYANPDDMINPTVKTVKYNETDSDYVSVICENGEEYALTLTGASMIMGYVKPGDYAFGNLEAARKAWKPLADNNNLTVEEAAEKALNLAAKKNSKVAQELIEEYKMSKDSTIFVGGGGGASVVVPHLADYLSHDFKIAKNGEVISTIGVALAMIRDMVERTIMNPTPDDILAIRSEAELLAINAGAAPETVEVSIDIDTSKNLVRATAIGATEFRSKDLTSVAKTSDELLSIVSDNLKVPKEALKIVAKTDLLNAIQCTKTEAKFFGLSKKVTTPTRIIDNEGVIRLQKQNGHVLQCNGSNWREALTMMLKKYTIYSDGGEELPNVYAMHHKKIIDLSGLMDKESIYSLAEVELTNALPDESIFILVSDRLD